MADIVVVGAHPHIGQSRITRRLLRAARQASAERPESIDVCDLYALYPDYCIDIAAEQARIAAARLIVWLHPIHWYSMPPLMKLWVDEVLAFGWAYGPEGKALSTKDLWLACSTGGTEAAYRPDGHNRYFFDAFLHPYEQTAALCGMRFLPPLVLHGAHRVSEAAVDEHAEIFTQRLLSYPDWPELDELPESLECAVPADDRPSLTTI
ncbi:MAG: NAD(P)H-dependent oxidoreductase [Burkholderiaceae bacterium]|nr:NAD(P)H-dependent oxidoreductase [Burkholderiaceae bacterium]